ncbi:MAG: hypothetical protein CMH57_09815 [Myxococcales bacterium]|nr:hypothetical protein [Myxococcales bacterium]
MTTITQDTTLALAAGQQQRPDSNDIPGIIQALTAGGHDDTSAMEETPAGEVTSETTTSEEALTETALIDNALTDEAPLFQTPLQPTSPPPPTGTPAPAARKPLSSDSITSFRWRAARSSWEEPEATPSDKPTAQAEEAPLGPMPDGILGIIDELLRDQHTLLRRLEAGQGLPTIARAMLLTVGICAVAVGASVGFYRGGAQILYAALKLPVVILMTVAICAPVYSALKAALQQKMSIASDFALILSALALASLVAMSLAPLLLLAAFQTIGYHHFILLVVGLCGLGGAVGYTLFFRGMHRQVSSEMNRRLIAVSVLIVLGLVSTQMTWIMRPYVVRPKTVETPFLRPFEGSFIDAVRRSVDSAQGIYHTDLPTPDPRADHAQRRARR